MRRRRRSSKRRSPCRTGTPEEKPESFPEQTAILKGGKGNAAELPVVSLGLFRHIRRTAPLRLFPSPGCRRARMALDGPLFSSLPGHGGGLAPAVGPRPRRYAPASQGAGLHGILLDGLHLSGVRDFSRSRRPEDSAVGRGLSLLLRLRRTACLSRPALDPWQWAVLFSSASSGWYGAQDIRTVHLTLATPKLPRGTERVRIAQLSDIHLGWIVQEERLSSMLEAVKAAEPDMLVITGDLVDREMQLFESETELFRQLRLPHGHLRRDGKSRILRRGGPGPGLHEKCWHAGASERSPPGRRHRIIAGVDDRTAARFGLYSPPGGGDPQEPSRQPVRGAAETPAEVSILPQSASSICSFRAIPTAARSGPSTGRPG